MAKITVQKTTFPETRSSAKNHLPLISNPKLREIHAAMVKCSMLAQRAEILFQQGKLTGDLHGSSGHEASASAFVIDLRREDVLSLSAGDWAPAFIKGMPLERMFRALAPAQDNDGRDDSPKAPDPLAAWNIQASTGRLNEQLKQVCDAAKAALKAKKGSIAVAFSAEEPGAHDSTHEAVAIAGSRKLPVIFVRYSNGALTAPRPAAPKRTRGAAPDATIEGVPVIIADGADAIALYRVACEAIARARQGRGPTLVESIIANSPCSAAGGSESIYKGSEQRSSQDAIMNMENNLRSKDLFSEELKMQVVTDFSRELDLATRFLNT
jgi:pyruvate dehydrogenase E1 component alpha subunit